MVIIKEDIRKKRTALNHFLNKNVVEKLSSINDYLKFNVFGLSFKILDKKIKRCFF